MAVRVKLGVAADEPIDDIVSLRESSGAKVFARDFGLPKVFGFSAGEDDGGPAVAVNVSSDVTIERQIFTAAHELGHLSMHPDSYGSGAGERDDREELEANQFGSYSLLPQVALDRELDEGAALGLIDFVLHVKRKFRVSYKTVLYRLANDYELGPEVYKQFAAGYKNRYGRSLQGHAEPDAIQGPIAKKGIEELASHDFVETGLARLVRKAYKSELISQSRAAEILGISAAAMRELAPKSRSAAGIAEIETPMDLFEPDHSLPAGLSLQDRVCLRLSQQNGYRCVTNDKVLRRACDEAGVAVLWGLQLMAELRTRGVLPISRAESVARKMSLATRRSITAEVVDAFLRGLRESRGVPVQIRVLDEQVVFWNPGRLPSDWTVDRLLSRRP